MVSQQKLALEGVKVVEYGSYITAPHCSKLLADLGAEVIKVEKPGQGDEARRRGPFLNDIPGTERSGFFLYLNTNKLGVTLNLEKATGRDIFRKLIKSADILIEDTKPGKLAAIGLGYENLKSLNPSLIMTSITAFGQTGPYKDYKSSDLIAWQMGGAGYVTPRWAGTADQEPLRAMQFASFMTGINAAVATMCALLVQKRSGLGQQVDVSLLESMVSSIAEITPAWPYVHRSWTRVSRPQIAVQQVIRCKDGWVHLHADESHHWRRLLDTMGNPEWGDEELFRDMYYRAEYWDSLEPLITEWATKYTKAELFALAKANKIPLGPVNSTAEVVENPQFRERDFFATVKHPVAGELIYPGASYKFSKTPWAYRKPAPLLGQHNEEIYCRRLGYCKRELVKMYQIGII